MAAEEKNPFMTAAPSEGGEYSLLEDGAYDSVCVGVTCRNFKKYQSEDLESKFQFIFQIKDGDQLHYLRTLPYRNVINDRSNLFTFLNTWTGVTLEKLAEATDLSKLIGFKAQIVVGTAEREGKKFNEIKNVLKVKKNSTVAFVPDTEAPAYLKNNLLAERWIDGLGFAAAKESAKADANATTDSGDDSDDKFSDLPF